MKVNNGKIVVPSGIEYKVLVLPDHKVLSMDALKKIEHLLSQGAEIIGYKPEHLVSLVGESKTQSEFHKLTEKIWGTSASKKGIKKYKKGVVAWGISARDYLMSKNLLPDFKILNDTVNTDNFDFIHYKFDNKDIYFVSNQTDKAQEIQCQFRISGFQPEIWDALNGEHREATSFYQKDNCTSLPLAFDPYGSIFIVFNKQIDKNRQGKDKSNYPDYETVKIIEGAWNVFFEPKLGGPGKVTFTGLTDWSTSSDNRIKYYSGPAIYYKTFDFSPEQGSNYSLQLEEVKDVGIAVVKINGKDKGITWTKPFRIDISNELINGENTLEIKIINSWYNRVVGDEIHPNENQLTKTNIVLENDFRGRPLEKIPLEPSGLLGPVSIAKRINKME
ncbi:hypothetical protein SDC9_116358 [bioreactor metagenome]|uniref:Glycosyl hydrolases family 2 sugar binding domain-containing protein n=1 Tax=bioreactor metagenome TaxID=1076179 RepID=A0A645C241_9ZZZZ